MDRKGGYEIVGLSEAGCVRQLNEDAISFDADIGLAVLADGMGGHLSGEVASSTAVTSIMEELTNKLRIITPGRPYKHSGYRFGTVVVRDAIKHANIKVYDLSLQKPQLKGMGTTVVVLLLYENRYTVAHVGDSRLYRFRNRQLKQITRDHSLVQELVERGECTPAQARMIPISSIITRAIGIEDTVAVEVHEGTVEADDIYLLCSDGLTKAISDELIGETLQQNRDNLNSAASQLINASIMNRGEDNISVILARHIYTLCSS